MRLSKLLERLETRRVSPVGSSDPEITAVVFDSRKAVPGCLFVCIAGNLSDGHTYIPEVVKAGAAAILMEEGHASLFFTSHAAAPSEGLQTSKNAPEAASRGEGTASSPKVASIGEAPSNAPEAVSLEEAPVYLETPNTRRALAFVSAAWFGYPAEHLPVIGITGTKGKTTTTYLVKSILENAGMKTGLIGTIEIIIGEEHIHATHTTPESYFVQEYLSRMLAAGCKCCVMEVSSQALMLDRTAGIPFEIGVFTNLGEDHIGQGEHKDFADYLHCKSLLFKQCKLGIVNADDTYVDDILKNSTCRVETFAIDRQDADLVATNINHIHEPGYLGVEFRVDGEDYSLPIPGKFSVYNALTAIAVCRHFGVDREVMKKALAGAHVKGRVELVPVSDKFTLLIDYAHNAMALESLLETLRDYHPHRLVTVFGCGGNRAKDRRYNMGEVSGKLADFTVITSDNPRFEEPRAIMADIEEGMARTDGMYIAIENRKEAIAWAIAHGELGDIIVLAGKGHEDYQEIRGIRYPMDERVLIREILEENVCRSS